MYRLGTIAFCLCILAAIVLLAIAAIDSNGASRPQVVEYEDHSARITFDGWTCSVPAYDSDIDRIVCRKGNQ